MFKALFGLLFWCTSMITVFAASPPYVVPTTMIDVINHLGLQASLKLCLDAGDLNSYSGSGQTWNDLSGNGYNFNRGTTTSSEASDPTFNGTAGRQSSGEYFSYDGGDYFTLGQANPSWVEQMHKAGAQFTIVEWAYANAIDASKPYAGVGSIASGGFALVGIEFGNDPTNGQGINIAVGNGGTGALVLNQDSTSHVINNNAWNMVGVSVNASTPSEIFIMNGTTESHAIAYVSPSSANATQTLQIGALGGGGVPDSSGNRIGGVAIWDRALSAAELTSLYNATKGKFGL